MSSTTTTAQVTLPPNDVDAERATLGAILLDAEIALPQVIPVIQPSDFYIVRHGWIYAASLALRARGESVDYITVTAELERRGQLEEAGGFDSVAALTGAAVTPLHARSYAQTIKDKAQRRDWLSYASDMAKAAYNGDFNHAEMLADLRQVAKAWSAEVRDDWRVFTLADAYAPRPPLQYVVDGIFPLPSLAAPYGPPGTLKTFLFQQVAICTAAGLPALEPLPGMDGPTIRTLQSPVMWINFDNSTRQTHERFEALGRAYNLPSDMPLFYVSMPQPWLDAGNLGAIDNLIERMKSRDVKFGVIDNLGVVSGRVDQNSDAMVPVMSNLRRLSEETGACICVIHHQRKNTGFTGRAGESLRGHGSIEAALDLALLVERKEQTDLLTVRSTKSRETNVVPFAAQFTYEHKPGTHELAAARFYSVDVPDPKADELAEVQTRILTALHDGAMNQRVLSELIGKRKDTTIAAVNSLIESGQVRRDKGARGAVIYALPV